MTDIAVVIPCVNQGRTLLAALESVARQSRPAAEVVVIDSGSDELFTRQVLGRIIERGGHVVQTPRRNVAAARNLGVAITSAPYLVLLGADDVLEPTYLEQAGAALDSDSSLDVIACPLTALEGACFLRTPAAWTFVDTLTRGGPHISSMFRRKVWEVAQGFDETLPECEDTDFWLSAISRGCRSMLQKQSFLHRRVHPDSRYPYAAAPAAHARTMTALYAKHSASVEREAAALLLGKESFLQELQAHRAELERERHAADARLAQLGHRVAEICEAIRRSGGQLLEWGDIRQVVPLSPVWGLDRGRPLDRYYIERFLERHSSDIRGRVLEVKDRGYTLQFGSHRVTTSDVVDIDPQNPHATVVADLTAAVTIPAESYDCIILTQTLHVIYDFPAVISELYRLLKPAGVVLCTLPCVSRVSYEDGGLDDGDYWRFTPAAALQAFSEAFSLDDLDVNGHGNVLAAAAFLHGLSIDELTREELDHTDPWFPVICTVRAVKPNGMGQTTGPTTHRRRDDAFGGAILAYHRIAALEPDTHRLCVSPDEFRAQMQHIRRFYEPLSLVELVQRMRDGRSSRTSLAITLDDGYLQCLTTAAPILTELGIPATFFICSDGLDEEQEFWWDTVERIFMHTGPLPAVLTVNGTDQVVPTGTPVERAAAHRKVAELLYSMSGDSRRSTIERIKEWSHRDHAVRTTHRAMTAREVRQLASMPGLTVGGHTRTHLALPLQPADVQMLEVSENKERLEDMVGQKVTQFAYPYGAHDDLTVEIVRRAGVEIAVTVKPRCVRLGDDPLRLPRLEVRAGLFEAFATKLRALTDPADLGAPS